jgi:anti-anti-sigma factor
MKGKKGQKKIEGEMNEDQDVEELTADSMLKPIGDLTIFEASQFHQDLCSLHQQQGPFVIDLSEIDRMDSSCVQLIVAATRSGRLTLKGYSSHIRDRFEQIGFSQFLPTGHGVS